MFNSKIKVINNKLIFILNNGNNNVRHSLNIENIYSVELSKSTEIDTIKITLNNNFCISLDMDKGEGFLSYLKINSLLKRNEIKIFILRNFKRVFKYFILPIIFVNIGYTLIFQNSINQGTQFLKPTQTSNKDLDLIKQIETLKGQIENIDQNKISNTTTVDLSKPNQHLSELMSDGVTKGYAINFSENSGPKIYVYSDPLCPFCIKFEKTLEEVKDQLSIKIFPVNVISGSAVIDNLNYIMCNIDENERSSAWEEMLLLNGSLTKDKNNNVLKKPECEKFILGNSSFLRSLKVQGTPAVFTDKGVQIPNNVLFNKNDLLNWIKNNG